MIRVNLKQRLVCLALLAMFPITQPIGMLWVFRSEALSFVREVARGVWGDWKTLVRIVAYGRY